MIRRLRDIGLTGLGICLVFRLILLTEGIMIPITGLLPTDSFVLNQTSLLHRLVRGK